MGSLVPDEQLSAHSCHVSCQKQSVARALLYLG